MRVRLLMVMFTAAALMGCGHQEAQFVSDEGVSELMRPARDAVEDRIEGYFGTPHNLVAWTELPVDYGRVEGEVAEGGKLLAPFKIQLTQSESATADESQDLSFHADDLSQAGVLWLSGAYQNATYEDDGQTKPVVFRVANYDADAQTLLISASVHLAPDSAVQKGDTFAIIGHTLQKGRQSYMRHCMHCHGVSGDGNGPTAQYLNPRPRDYRQGVFKFTSTGPTDKVRIDDLKRIVKLGIPGTYMPSFMLLPEDELNAIVTYVRWLAMRGELERKLLAQLSTDFSQQRLLDGDEPREDVEQELDEFLVNDLPTLFEELTEELVADWSNPEESETAVVMPKVARTDPHADPESINRGRKLFLGNRVKCLSCHGTAGRGNGPSNEDFNDVPGSNPPVKSDKPGLFDVWGRQIKPRDLTQGIYRGGRRPLDIYRRIYSGIKGTPMQAFGTTLKDEEIWDLVNYVLSVPFEDLTNEERAKLYQLPQQQAATDSPSDVGS